MRKLIFLWLVACVCVMAAVTPGTYKGEWSGAATGGFRLTLAQGGDGVWSANVVFTLGNTEVKTKVTSVTVEGDKLNVIYQYDLQGTQLQSNVTGELKGKTFEGAYKATLVADGAAVDEGTWKATAEE